MENNKVALQVYDGVAVELTAPYMSGFEPRLVQSMKSAVIRDSQSLAREVSHYLFSEIPKIRIDMIYGRLIPLLSQMGEDGQNALTGVFSRAVRSVRSWLKATLDALSFCGSPSVSLQEQRRFFCKYFLLALQNKGEKALKFHLTYIFAKSSRQPDLAVFSQKKPQEDLGLPGVLFGGSVKSFIERRLFLKSFNDKTSQMAYTLFQSKRAWLPISRSQVIEALHEHRQALCEPRELQLNPQLIEEVRRTVREVFPKLKKNTCSSRVPSSSSCYGISRREGGSQFALSDYVQSDEFGCNTELIGFIVLPKGKLFEFRGFVREEKVLFHFQTEKLDLALKSIISDADDVDLEYFEFEKILRTEVHVVLEPAKARIITAGPCTTYHRVRLFQKEIFNILSRHPTFQLVGRPLDESVMEWFSKQVRYGRDGRYYLSGDYSGATDNLHPELIKAAADELCKRLGLSDGDSELYKRSLSDHLIQYPKMSHPDHVAKFCDLDEDDEPRTYEPKEGQQVWGQLMGSPSSFPILCIVNAAVNRFFYESTLGVRTTTIRGKNVRCYHKYRLSEIPMLINGDDILMSIDPSTYEKWWKLVRTCGLEPSLGKNYISDKFAMINSQLWMENRDCFGSHSFWKFRPFVQLGLLCGQSKVLSDTRRPDEQTGRAGDLISNADCLLKGFKGEDRERLYSLWLKINKEKINDVTLPGQNWFVPRQLGGLGLPQPDRYEVTRGQAKLASYLKFSTKMESVPELGLIKPTYLRMEEIYTKGLVDALEWEWADERRDDLPFLTNYFESIFGIPGECKGEELRREMDHVSRKWDHLWAVGTNHSLKKMEQQEMRVWGIRYKVLSPGQHIGLPVFPKSVIFNERYGKPKDAGFVIPDEVSTGSEPSTNEA